MNTHNKLFYAARQRKIILKTVLLIIMLIPLFSSCDFFSDIATRLGIIELTNVFVGPEDGEPYAASHVDGYGLYLMDCIYDGNDHYEVTLQNVGGLEISALNCTWVVDYSDGSKNYGEVSQSWDYYLFLVSEIKVFDFYDDVLSSSYDISPLKITFLSAKCATSSSDVVVITPDPPIVIDLSL